MPDEDQATQAERIAETRALVNQAKEAIERNQQILDKIKADRAGRARDLGLQRGMSLDAVRQLLTAWEDHPVRLGGNAANPIHTWDFTPPTGSDQEPIRLTFDNSGLVAWGAPVDQGGEGRF